MIEILKFIFSSFWIWLGTFLLVSAVAFCFAAGIHGLVNIHKEDNSDHSNTWNTAEPKAK